ncbi:MAG: hypothetical protein ABL983_19855, partial [Nitrospira sp.]
PLSHNKFTVVLRLNCGQGICDGEVAGSAMQSFQNDHDRRSPWILSRRSRQVLEASEFYTSLMVAYVEPLSEATCLREALRRRQGTPPPEFAAAC